MRDTSSNQDTRAGHAGLGLGWRIAAIVIPLFLAGIVSQLARAGKVARQVAERRRFPLT